MSATTHTTEDIYVQKFVLLHEDTEEVVVRLLRDAYPELLEALAGNWGDRGRPEVYVDVKIIVRDLGDRYPPTIRSARHG